MNMPELAHLIGRVLFSWLFILSGYRHLTGFKGMAGYAKAVGNVPMPEVAVIVTGLMMLGGGFSVLLGFHPRVGTALLAASLVPTAFIMHPFWKRTDPMQRAGEEAQFWKNIALAGAAIFIGANPHWPWPMSLG
ncbi:MAG: DoxX family protein [Gemmatimonadota bacterium]|jgi:uncharacterized membrane protein YphA (DoxX/SURF4 family)